MNGFLKIFSLAFISAFVRCDLAEKVNQDSHDNCVVYQLLHNLDNYTLEQSVNFISVNFPPVMQMASKRGDLAKSKGLLCYSDFYVKYRNYFSNFLNDMNATIANDKESNKTDSVRKLAQVVVKIVWDENVRVQRRNIPVETTELDTFDNSLMLKLRLDVLVKVLTTLLSVDQSNTFIAEFQRNLGELFSRLYVEGEECCMKLPQYRDEELCLKVFVKEIERFLGLLILGTVDCNKPFPQLVLQIEQIIMKAMSAIKLF